MKLLFALILVQLALAQSPPRGWRPFTDPQKRFKFIYPEAFGNPSTGSDSGFRNRVAAIQFANYSAGARGTQVVFGGEAVLTSGPPQIDLQAAGGLYDPVTLQALPTDAAAVIQKALPILTASSFCSAITVDQHLAAATPALVQLTAEQRQAIPALDRMGNYAPIVLYCQARGDTVTFDKASKPSPAGAPRRIYGAIRFLQGSFSSFQLIRGAADAPTAALLDQVTAVVDSWEER